MRKSERLVNVSEKIAILWLRGNDYERFVLFDQRGGLGRKSEPFTLFVGTINIHILAETTGCGRHFVGPDLQVTWSWHK